MRKVEVLRCRGRPIQNTERKFLEKLERILNSMRSPYARLQELAASSIHQEQQKDVFLQTKEEDLSFLYTTLNKQREGLEFAVEVLRKDIRDISIVKQKINEL